MPAKLRRICPILAGFRPWPIWGRFQSIPGRLRPNLAQTSTPEARERKSGPVGSLQPAPARSFGLSPDQYCPTPFSDTCSRMLKRCSRAALRASRTNARRVLAKVLPGGGVLDRTWTTARKRIDAFLERFLGAGRHIRPTLARLFPNLARIGPYLAEVGQICPDPGQLRSKPCQFWSNVSADAQKSLQHMPPLSFFERFSGHFTRFCPAPCPAVRALFS